MPPGVLSRPEGGITDTRGHARDTEKQAGRMPAQCPTVLATLSRRQEAAGRCQSCDPEGRTKTVQTHERITGNERAGCPRVNRVHISHGKSRRMRRTGAQGDAGT